MKGGKIDEGMSRMLYVVRHVKAEGQEPEAALTADGRSQAEALAAALADLGVDHIVSSTFRRAIESIRPLADRLAIAIATDDRLIEASLSSINHPDWLTKLKATFEDDDLCFEGGESSGAATERAIAAVEAVLRSTAKAPVVVTHGRLATLLLRRYDRRFGFEDWQALSTPDLFRIDFDDSQRAVVTRLWK